jgi:hypothetical protein
MEQEKEMHGVLDELFETVADVNHRHAITGTLFAIFDSILL